MTEEKKTAEPAKAATTAAATPPKAPAASAGATEKAPDTVASTTAPEKATETPKSSGETGSVAPATPKPIEEATRTVDEDEFEKARNEPESPVPSDDDLDEADGLPRKQGATTRGLDETQTAQVTAVLEKLANLSLDVIQAGSPDSYNLFGYSGINISLGEIRALSRAYRMGKN